MSGSTTAWRAISAMSSCEWTSTNSPWQTIAAAPIATHEKGPESAIAASRDQRARSSVRKATRARDDDERLQEHTAAVACRPIFVTSARSSPRTRRQRQQEQGERT